MRVTFIEVPYDSGHFGVRMGSGPLFLTGGDLMPALERLGHEVDLVGVRLEDDFLTEVTAAVALQRRVSAEVSRAHANGRFPIVLSGNCATCVGTMAGSGCQNTGVIWLDSHADLNTPATTPSGFLDGQVLAMMLGDGWDAVAATVPGFSPVPAGHVTLVGARDLDPPEWRQVERRNIPVVGTLAIRELGADAAVAGPLASLDEKVDGLYVHLDLDVLDPSEARVNLYQAPGGPTVEEVLAIIDAASRAIPFRAAALTAFDAEGDVDGRAGEAAIRLIVALVAAADRAPNRESEEE